MSSDLLKQLSDASQIINQATDEFNQQIKAIEDALASYNIGVSAWVRSHKESEDHLDDFGDFQGQTCTEYFLGYQKVGGKWSLMAATERDDSEPEDSRTEWVFRDAPRYVRVKTIGAIPKLVEALIRGAHELAKDLVEQAKQAHAFAESIKPKKGQ